MAYVDKNRKIRYVAVDVYVDAKGKLCPKRVYWADGTVYEINHVLEEKAVLTFSRTKGARAYTVCVGNTITNLYYDPPRWFVEEKPKRAC